MEKTHVLFVREIDQQMSSSGCCGRLEGDVINMSTSAGEDALFCERRVIMEEVGALYRQLDETFGEQIELEIIDPRNIVILILTLIKQSRKNHHGFKQTISQFLKGFHTKSVFVNGQLISYGKFPPYDELHKEVYQAVYHGKERLNDGLEGNVEPVEGLS